MTSKSEKAWKEYLKRVKSFDLQLIEDMFYRAFQEGFEAGWEEGVEAGYEKGLKETRPFVTIKKTKDV